MATHNATIERKEDAIAILKLAIGSEELKIVLTEDNPNSIKSVFNKKDFSSQNDFYNQIRNGKIIGQANIICKEYITQLNAELKSTYTELKDNDLLNDKE